MARSGWWTAHENREITYSICQGRWHCTFFPDVAQILPNQGQRLFLCYCIGQPRMLTLFFHSSQQKEGMEFGGFWVDLRAVRYLAQKSMWRGSFKMWCTQVVLVTWRLCSTEEDLLYSHKCASLIKLHTEIPSRKHMSKSGQCDSAVKAAAAQGLVTLELQLNALRHSLTFHSTPALEK